MKSAAKKILGRGVPVTGSGLPFLLKGYVAQTIKTYGEEALKDGKVGPETFRL